MPRLSVAGILLLVVKLLAANEALAVDITKYPSSPGEPRKLSLPAALFAEGQIGYAFGVFGTSLNVKLPPARNGLVPLVALEYSTTRTHQGIGWGWELPIDHVKRSQRFGVPNYDAVFEFSGTPFEYRLGEARGELVYVGDEGGKKLFRPKRDDIFAKFYYEPVQKYWTVMTKDGRVRTLGDEANARDEDPDLPARTRIFAWYVTSIRDTLCNEIRYRYKDYKTEAGHVVRVSDIEYDRRVVSGSCTQAATRATMVSFTWAPGPGNLVTYNKGWETILDRLKLTAITVTAADENGQAETASYTIGYQPGPVPESQVPADFQFESQPPTHVAYHNGPAGFDWAQTIPDSTPTCYGAI